jgi:hypothetical protein
MLTKTSPLFKTPGIRVTPDLSRVIELAWAAGFFDGEGCTKLQNNFSRHGKNYPNIAVSITQYHSEVLERFRLAVGTGSVYGPYPRAEGKQAWAFGAWGEKAEAVVDALWPYLGSVKREQAKRIRLLLLES